MSDSLLTRLDHQDYAAAVSWRLDYSPNEAPVAPYMMVVFEDEAREKKTLA